MWNRPQPERSTVEQSPRLRTVNNALALTLLARVRDKRSGPDTFAAAARQLATILLSEACHDLPLRPTSGVGFAGDEIEIHRLAERVAGVAILRAGLLFEHPFRALLPDAPLYTLGLRRDEETLCPDVYYDQLPQHDGWAERVLLLDPMLATGGTAQSAIQRIRQHVTGPIEVVCLVAAPLGVETVLETDPECRIVAAALDERLDEPGFIRPGLGDAGDRFFGTG